MSGLQSGSNVSVVLFGKGWGSIMCEAEQDVGRESSLSHCSQNDGE